MKNSTKYVSKVKKLLSGAKDGKAPAEVDRLRLMVRAVMEEDAPARQVNEAMSGIESEFVNLNELRVGPVKDIMECMGRRFPRGRIKAEMVTNALNGVFDRSNTLSLDYLQNKPKRELRKALREELGLSRYAEAVITLYGFSGHAIPVDHLLLEALKLNQCVDPSCDLEDLQGFLERLVLSKDAIGAHEALRAFCLPLYPKLEKVIQQRAREDEATIQRTRINQPREPMMSVGEGEEAELAMLVDAEDLDERLESAAGKAAHAKSHPPKPSPAKKVEKPIKTEKSPKAAAKPEKGGAKRSK
jgi:hypothetical protein